MVNNKIILIVIGMFIAMFFISLTSAVNPVATSNQQVGIEIEHPIIDPIRANITHDFRFHLYNATNGVPIYTNNTAIGCTFHMYDISGEQVVTDNNVSRNGTYDWEENVGAGNFTNIGQYAYVFQCQEDNVAGGFLAHPFTVTESGYLMATSDAILYLAMGLFAMLIFVLTLYGAIKIKWKPDTSPDGKIINKNKLRYLKIIFYAFAYIEFVWMNGIAVSLSNNLLYTEAASAFFEYLFYISLVLAYPITVLALIFALIVFFQDRSWRKRAMRGFSR